MDMKPGSLAVSTAGHDKGDLVLVVKLEGNAVWVSDGRQRPLERPKKKNPKHLKPVSATIAEEDTQSNRRLRKALFKLKSDNKIKEGSQCQSRI